MIYSKTLLVPANTPEGSPVSIEFEVEEPYLTRLDVHFPDGCALMVRVRFMYGVKQLFPQPEDAWLVGNGETVSWDEVFRLWEKPIKIRCEACSPGTSYQHQLAIRLITKEEEAIPPWKAFRDLFARIMRIFT